MGAAELVSIVLLAESAFNDVMEPFAGFGSVLLPAVVGFDAFAANAVVIRFIVGASVTVLSAVFLEVSAGVDAVVTGTLTSVVDRSVLLFASVIFFLLIDCPF